MQNLTKQSTSSKLQIAGLVLFLAFYAIISAFLEHRKYPVHRGAVAVIIGVVFGLFLRMTSAKMYNFIAKMDQTIIFLVLLPTILFAKGYTFKKGAFVKNIKYIILFGVIGTFLSYIIVSSLIYAANNLNLIRDASDITNIRTLSIWQIILLSACMCSIDPVASQQAVSENRFPRLNSIIVGEDVFKDCVTFVLFRSILKLEGMETPSKFIFYWNTPFVILFHFEVMIVGSIVFGAAMAAATAFLFKKVRFMQKDKGVTETTVLFLLGFATYVLVQSMNLSGVVGILCYGVFLNKYNYFNLSESGQITTKNTFLFVANISEGLLYLIMGIMVWEVKWEQQSPDNPITHSYIFCFVVFLILLVGRIFNVLLLWFVCNKATNKFPLKKQELFIIFMSGISRGATPFALFTSVELTQQNNKYAKNQGLVLKTTIIIIIMFCTIFYNSFIPKLYKKPLLKLRKQAKQYLIQKNNEDQEQRKQNKIQKLVKSYWKRADENTIKPLLIFEYEKRKGEIDQIKQKIKMQGMKQALEQMQEQQQELGFDANLKSTQKLEDSILSN